ncbi:hypothetical protein GCM10009676_11830 [Prauserella halophila]|uniref:Uncharacterized protein n=1 Tax=Prauserella halophila TaxID=185641 RepID=A0ABN1W172_9PSEU|nr:hypothetical protein [Prauserella halophila]MCP2236598.1 hypothetical protein [Prauserella halophila]
MGISGRADLPWMSSAVDETRRRGAVPGQHDPAGEAGHRRQEQLDVEAWEVRRRGRTVRLWSAELLVRTTARDAGDAAFRLVTLAHPYHRTGHAPRLYSVAGPVLGQAPSDGVAPAGPRNAWPGGDAATGDAATGEDAERAQAAGHAAALDRAGGGTQPSRAATFPLDLPCWQAWQRVSFLAGPGDAPARAAELAATVVGPLGEPAAVVTRLEPQDGRRDPVGGRLVHPACDAGSAGIDALWNDFDAVDGGLGDPGEPVALAAVCLAAARELRAEFGLRPDRPVPAGGRVDIPR